MNVEGLERRIDECLVKQGAKTLGGAVAETAAYMTPVVGAGLTLRDAYRDFKGGHIWRGLGNTALGITSGALDIASIIAAATGLGAPVGAAGAAASGAIRAGRAAKAVSAAKGAVKGVVGARNAARMAAGGAKYLNAMSRAGQAVNSAKGWVRGSKAYTQMANAANRVRNTGRLGNWAVNNAKRVGRFGYDWTIGAYTNTGRGMVGRGVNRALMGEAGAINYGMNQLGDYLDYKSNPYRQQARQQADSYGGVLWNHGDNFGRGNGQQYQIPDFSQYGQPDFQQFNNWNQR